MSEPRTAAGRALLDLADEDDVIYDHPRAMSGEPMDPVLFVRWGAVEDAILAIPAEAAELAGGLAELLRETIETVHQTGSIRDHSDPNDRTGWNVHGIETCADSLCVDALAALAAYRQSVVITPGQDETPRTGEASP